MATRYLYGTVLTEASDLLTIYTASYGSEIDMRVPNEAHESRPWRIHEIAPDFRLEDVWALPVQGGAADFQTLLEYMVSSDPLASASAATRALWGARDCLGRWLGLGSVSAASDEDLPIPGDSETSLVGRLPDELRDTAADLQFAALPFVPLYRTDDEFAAELSNQTVHAVMHLGWVDQGEGRYQGQMAVYVKPRGLLGEAYMAFIKPFRLCIVYPAMMKRIEREWVRPRRSSLSVR